MSVKNNNKPTVYIHFHKCGGTSIVESAKQSGFELHPNHVNGSFVEIDNINSDTSEAYTDLETLNYLYRNHFSKPGQFISFEWFFPKYFLDSIRDNVTLFTVIRNPLDRAFSNYAFDLQYGYTDRDRFLEYFDNKYFYCSDNYYIRKLVNKKANEPVVETDLELAMECLDSFNAVFVLEDDKIDEKLSKLGISLSRTRYNKSSKTNSLPDNIIKEFEDLNSFDIKLYNHICRTII